MKNFTYRGNTPAFSKENYKILISNQNENLIFFWPQISAKLAEMGNYGNLF